MSEHGLISREAEEWAIATLRKYFNSNAKVVDRSQDNDHDFEIHYLNGRRAVGEVGLLADGEYEAAWSALTRRKQHHQYELPEGSGTWGTHLYRKPNIKAFESAIAPIIDELNAIGLLDFHVGMHVDLRHLDKKCEAVGIQYLRKHSSIEGDRVVYFLDKGHTFFIDNTLDSLVSAIQGAMTGSEFQDTWLKLQNLEADERHLFYKCGSLIDGNHQLVLLSPSPELEIPEITFPPGITDIWVAPEYLEAKIVHWSASGGREFVDPPEWRLPPTESAGLSATD